MTEATRECALYEPLLSGALDNELTQQQQQLLQHHLQRCEYCSAKLAQLEQQSAALRAVRQAMPEPTTMPHFQTTNTPVWQWLGWLLMLIGLLVIGGWAAYQYVQDASLPIWLKLAVGAVYLGLAVLFIGVAWQRKQQAKTDRYKKVQL